MPTYLVSSGLTAFLPDPFSRLLTCLWAQSQSSPLNPSFVCITLHSELFHDSLCLWNRVPQHATGRNEAMPPSTAQSVVGRPACVVVVRGLLHACVSLPGKAIPSLLLAGSPGLPLKFRSRPSSLSTRDPSTQLPLLLLPEAHHGLLTGRV